MDDSTGSDISEVFGGSKDRTADQQRSFSVLASPRAADMTCVLEPVCLDEFIFSPCPHPEANCIRHRYETLADREGGRTYGEARWKLIKSVDPGALVQMIEQVRNRERLSTH